MRIVTTAMLLSVVLPLRGERVLAQQTRAGIALSGGVATDQRGVSSSAVTIAPTLGLHASQSAALLLGGNATRFATQVWSVGGSATLALRNPIGRFLALTLTGSASATRLTSAASGTFAVADVVPALEMIAGPLTLFAGARAAAGRASQPGIPTGAAPIFGGPRDVATDVTASSRLGAVFGGALGVSREAVAVQVGVRTEPADGTALTAVASLPLSRELSLDVAAGCYPANDLLDTPAGSYASAGLSIRFGGPHRSSLPRPSGVRSPRAGMTRLAIHARDARQVELAGDFTDWKFIAATRAANGVWYADLRIPPGQYRYAFRINGSEWRVPNGATAVDDGFGGKSAWLTVPDRPGDR